MGSEYLELFPLYVNGSDLNISTVNEIYAQACYDAMWTMAFALDSTITGIIFIINIFSYVCLSVCRMQHHLIAKCTVGTRLQLLL